MEITDQQRRLKNENPELLVKTSWLLFLLPGLKLYSETLSKHREQENSGAKLFFLHQHASEDILWVPPSLELVAGRSCYLVFPDLLRYLLFLLLLFGPYVVSNSL